MPPDQYAAEWAKGLKKRVFGATAGDPPSSLFLHDGHVWKVPAAAPPGGCMYRGAWKSSDLSSCISCSSLLFSSLSVSQHFRRNSHSTSVFLSFVLQRDAVELSNRSERYMYRVCMTHQPGSPVLEPYFDLPRTKVQLPGQSLFLLLIVEQTINTN